MDTTAHDDENLVMLSALLHWQFCKRRCALILLEGIWTENRLTALGHVMHDHVHKQGSETRRTLRQATGVRLVSRRLGVFGIADMVEFHLSETEQDATGNRIAVALPGLSGVWRPFPVEYKRGMPNSHRADEVQLCAQAICLEEMLGVQIPSGALFYGEPRRRTEVVFDAELRRITEDAALGVHSLFVSGNMPPPSIGKWCASCSLVEDCRPKILASHCSARAWLNKELDGIQSENLP